MSIWDPEELSRHQQQIRKLGEMFDNVEKYVDSKELRKMRKWAENVYSELAKIIRPEYLISKDGLFELVIRAKYEEEFLKRLVH